MEIVQVGQVLTEPVATRLWLINIVHYYKWYVRYSYVHNFIYTIKERGSASHVIIKIILVAYSCLYF